MKALDAAARINHVLTALLLLLFNSFHPFSKPVSHFVPGRLRDSYISMVTWISSTRLAVRWLNRVQNQSVLCVCEATTGACSEVSGRPGSKHSALIPFLVLGNRDDFRQPQTSAGWINIKGRLLHNQLVWWLPADCSLLLRRLYSCFQSLVQLLIPTVIVTATHRFLNELKDLQNLKNVVFFCH